MQKISISDDDGIVNSADVPYKFNNYFTNIANELVSKIAPVDTNASSYLKNRISNSFFMSPIVHNEIEHAISGLKVNKGINTISTNILNEIKTEISEMLAYIFNMCIEQGYFPTELKVGCITPIFKKGNKFDITNYRPVCSLSQFSKIFEKIVYTRMVDFINKNNIFSETQYGFRKNKSTETALIDFTDYVHNGLTNKQNVGSIFMDLSKAFDVMDHSILKTKLEHYGFRGKFLDYIMSFMKDREYFVYVNGYKSSTEIVNIGVPQGSTLGPLLFLIYVNDMKYCSNILKFIQFADDTTLIFTHPDILELNRILEIEATKVIKWLSANKLIINLTKTHSMLFTNKRGNLKLSISIHGITMEEKVTTKFLGVEIDNKLTWKDHIQFIASKVSKTISLLRRLRHTFPKRILRMIYMSLIYSYLNYCIIIWGSAYNNALDPLYILQKKAVRLINNSHYLDHTLPIFNSLKLLTLRQIFELNCLNFIYKCTKTDQFPEFKRKLLNNLNAQNYNTRGANLLRTPFVRLDICKRSYFYKGITLWNKLDKTTQNSKSIKIFKKNIKYQLLQLTNPQDH